ncbi:hypothetical protein FDECE_13023 [Fusarium decemcellulare]|nr:hypothetical protein FDECE_13023 [Fusarium decemcellulare]
MTDNRRVEWFLGRAGLVPPQKILPLVEPPAQDYQPFSASNRDAARRLLVQQRTKEPGYKPPEQQKRNLFRTKQQKEEATNQNNWTFTKHEVAKALDELLSQPSLPAAGVGQALLLYTTLTSLDELWGHFHDAQLERKMKKNRMSSGGFYHAELSWLDKATSHDNIDYIQLLCQTRVSQGALDRAFGIALSKSSISGMKLLLSFGAVATSYHAYISEHFIHRNLELVKLLLSAPDAMRTEIWLECLQQEVARAQSGRKFSLDTLLLCLGNRSDLVSEDLLIATLGLQNLEATAVVLAYAGSNDRFFGIRQRVCEIASAIQDGGLKLAFLTLLAESGLVSDCLALREELIDNVRARRLPLVQLLVGAGICVDANPHNALKWAVSQLDFSILEMIRLGVFSSPISSALNYVSPSISETDMIRFMNIFGPMGVTGESLNRHLVRAVRNKQIKLVETLLHYGASVEYDHVAAIRTALTVTDFAILSLLLQGDCLLTTLSAAVPCTMGLTSRPDRLRAMKALLEKGIPSQELVVPVQQLASESGEMDLDLLRLLLEHEAPVDVVDDADSNPVLLVTKRGDISALEMLCSAGPRPQTLSAAVPIAFNRIETAGSESYDAALKMITLLLQKGATGPPVDQTLLEATSKDGWREIVRTLLQNGADANHAAGASYISAIEKRDIGLLEILCHGCPPTESSLEKAFLTCIDPRHYNLQILEVVLSSEHSPAVLNASWGIDELLKDHPNLTEIVPCLLSHGLDVNVENGLLLCFAVGIQNVELLTAILVANSDTASLTAAFQAATKMKSREVQLRILKLLLEKAASAEIGQSEALLGETKAALGGDLDGLQLLLRHKASVDFDDGRALQEAAVAGIPTVLYKLLLAGASKTTIEKAFTAATTSSLHPEIKYDILKSLLTIGGNLSPGVVSNALAGCISNHPDDAKLPELLLTFGAKANLDMLKTALASSPPNVFKLLVDGLAETATAQKMFMHVRKFETDAGKRYTAYSCLVGKGIQSHELSEALLHYVETYPGNFVIPKMLLENGAEVNYKDGAIFTAAFKSKELKIVRTLCQYLVKNTDVKTASLSFDYVTEQKSIDPDVRLEIYTDLLKFNISKESLYKALVSALEHDSFNHLVVQLLLEQGVDPNQEEARCFALACHKASVAKFRALAKYADIKAVLPALMKQIKSEFKITGWFRILFEELPKGTRIENQDDLLFQCMRTYPNGTMLLDFLLKNGVSASTKTTLPFRKKPDPEESTALMWAIASSHGIDNKVIIRLLSEGNEALPMFCTAKTHLSAVFLCLLDKSRTPVLQALLDLKTADVMNSTISGATFSKIAVAKKPKRELQALFEEEDEMSPREAALFLGNLDAFKLISKNDLPNDGTLHLAALLALPDFVTWLLETHDPNFASEDYGFMVPLAMACFSKPFPWCSVANAEAAWGNRVKETMKILIPKTLSAWRYRQKLVLHLALENGPEVTKALIEALDVRHEADKEKTYLYTDKTGMHYSPCEYVRTFLEAGDKEKNKLVACLEKHGLK